jgi:hypothetical protein
MTVAPLPEAAAEDAPTDDANRRYTAKVEMTEMSVNSRDELTLVIAGDNGFTIDPQFAHELTFRPEVGDEVLVARKTKYRKKDAEIAEDGSELRWKVSLMAKKAGKHPVTLKASFQVCRKKECHHEITELRLKVVVKD